MLVNRGADIVVSSGQFRMSKLDSVAAFGRDIELSFEPETSRPPDWSSGNTSFPVSLSAEAIVIRSNTLFKDGKLTCSSNMADPMIIFPESTRPGKFTCVILKAIERKSSTVNLAASVIHWVVFTSGKERMAGQPDVSEKVVRSGNLSQVFMLLQPVAHSNPETVVIAADPSSRR